MKISRALVFGILIIAAVFGLSSCDDCMNNSNSMHDSTPHDSKGDIKLIYEYVSGKDNGISNIFFAGSEFPAISYTYDNKRYEYKFYAENGLYQYLLITYYKTRIFSNEEETTTPEENYSEAIVNKSGILFDIDVEKSSISFFANSDESSIVETFIYLETDSSGNYLIYKVGDEIPTFIAPDKVIITGTKFKICEETQTIIRYYDDGTNEMRWKTENVLYVPEGSMIKKK